MSCSVVELPTRYRIRGMGTGAPSGTLTTTTFGGPKESAVTSATSSSSTTTSATVQSSAKGGIQRPPQKPCCFCWCCCCSCSWAKCLAIKNGEENCPTRRDPSSSDLLPYDGEQPPLDEIRMWGKNFDKLMKSPAGRTLFRDFLRGEYSEENILFWMACEELKKEKNPALVEEKARFIYEDYISILSPKEVSLDSHVREIVNRNMVEPTPHTFDDAQLQIYTLMHRDSYPRFVNSTIFKNMAQLPETVSASASKSESPK